ncbi:HvfC/BufC family peptide modification chaperone [Rhizobacter sp. P5_C2]
MNELDRQQALLRSLWARDDGASLAGAVSEQGARLLRGWQAYQANGGASAERALATRYPTVQAMLGEESFGALARAFWQAQPPQRGDLAEFGEALPGFITASDQLADVPYVADSARLDALVARCEQSADIGCDTASLALLAQADPAELTLTLEPAVGLLSSAWPAASLWLAHRPGDEAARHLDAAREALAAGRGEHALVWRDGWRAQVRPIGEADARWTQALLDGVPLSSALDRAGEAFAFEPWLLQAVQHGWLTGARAAKESTLPADQAPSNRKKPP